MTLLHSLPALVVAVAAAPLFADPLPSWNDTPARAAIVAFVESVTDPAADASLSFATSASACPRSSIDSGDPR